MHLPLRVLYNRHSLNTNHMPWRGVSVYVQYCKQTFFFSSTLYVKIFSVFMFTWSRDESFDVNSKTWNAFFTLSATVCSVRSNVLSGYHLLYVLYLEFSFSTRFHVNGTKLKRKLWNVIKLEQPTRKKTVETQW